MCAYILTATAPRECQTSRFFHWLRLIEFIFITIVPAIPLVITNAKMALILLRRRKIWLSPLYTTQTHGATMSGVHSNDTEAIGDTFHGKMVRNIHRDVQHQERQLTLQLFLVSVTFCLLSLPSVIIIGIDVFVELRSSNPHQSEFLSDALHLSLFSFAVNLTINFVIYCLVGKKFRRAVGALIMCKCDQYRRLRSELLSVSDTAMNSFNLSRDAPVTRHRPKSTGLISEPLNVDEFIRVL
ncbi:hypothetical protein FGIG_05632 [Fasciola gigantica]|uniref:G-protein coupled receptors family 1 profile domain-containing protein n=1 Tax=Fasciola gigantica TaxID=46835 RepID=A0A504Y793_FASGI|nr:hypothetical protein FGIG_05632 [Fasciola gigantica]